jgi:hypothetical protein
MRAPWIFGSLGFSASPLRPDFFLRSVSARDSPAGGNVWYSFRSYEIMLLNKPIRHTSNDFKSNTHGTSSFRCSGLKIPTAAKVACMECVLVRKFSNEHDKLTSQTSSSWLSRVHDLSIKARRTPVLEDSLTHTLTNNLTMLVKPDLLVILLSDDLSSSRASPS